MRRVAWLGSVWAAVSLGASACGGEAQTQVDYPVRVQGTAQSTITVDAWTVTFTRAEMALGPLYLCTTAAPSADQCSEPLQELASAVPVDLLSAQPAEARLRGFTGNARSAQFDYGVTWRATQSRPTALSASPQGHSAVFAGRATQGSRTFTFRAEVDVVTNRQGEYAVGSYRVPGDNLDGSTPLTITADPSQWWTLVDLDELAALGQDHVTLAPDSRASLALAFGMNTSGRPRFEWRTTPP
jgi:hypothetical protein